VLDNEVYGETGGQASHTASTVDLVGVAKASGISDARPLSTMAEIEAFYAPIQDVSSGPRFASIKIDSANLERVLASRDGSFIVTRNPRCARVWPDLNSCRCATQQKP